MEGVQEQVIAFLKGEMSEEDRAHFAETLGRSSELRAELERTHAVLDLLEAANDENTVRLVNTLIREAIQKGASDIHLTPERGELVAYLRLDGNLTEHSRVSAELRQPVIDRWKVMSECSLAERQLPQDGRISVSSEGQEFDLRVTFLPTARGERVTARILVKGSMVASLADLGMLPSTYEAVKRLIRLPNGLVAVFGAVGSGKTTLIYSLLEEILKNSAGRKNILTVEDPVEFVMDGLSQTSVNRQRGLTYAAALRGIFRSDPDIVFIADLPDEETAGLAMQVAATGHLVFTALIGGSAVTGIQRLQTLVADPLQVPQVLAGLISMRLLRKTCRECIAAYEPAVADLRRLGLTAADGPFQRGAGCEACRQTGYRGRTALFEVLEIDPVLSAAIAEGATPEALWEAGFRTHGGSLLHDAREKVRQGVTTAQEASRVLFDYPHRIAQPAA